MPEKVLGVGGRVVEGKADDNKNKLIELFIKISCTRGGRSLSRKEKGKEK